MPTTPTPFTPADYKNRTGIWRAPESEGAGIPALCRIGELARFIKEIADEKDKIDGMQAGSTALISIRRHSREILSLLGGLPFDQKLAAMEAESEGAAVVEIPHIWREADELIIMKLPGMEEFRISNEGANAMLVDLQKVVGGKRKGMFKTPPTKEWVEAHANDDAPEVIGVPSQPHPQLAAAEEIANELSFELYQLCESVAYKHCRAVGNGYKVPEQEEIEKLITAALARHSAAKDAEMIAWRSLAQEMTPGGSEFMSREVVRKYYREFKDGAHRAKIDRVQLQRKLSDKDAEIAEIQKSYDRLLGAVNGTLPLDAEYMRSLEKNNNFLNAEIAELLEAVKLAYNVSMNGLTEMGIDRLVFTSKLDAAIKNAELKKELGK